MAAQAPWWEPGTASGYQALNYGHLIGEILRRSPASRSSVSSPTRSRGRSARTSRSARRKATGTEFLPVVPPPPQPIDLEALGMDSPAVKTFTGPLQVTDYANAPDWRRADIGAANGHGNARSVARVMSVVARGGEVQRGPPARPGNHAT